jgi:hypothetical protein
MKTIYKSALALSITLLIFTGCGDAMSDDMDSNSMQMSIDLSNYTQDALTDEQKYSLAYMWHEERLAYDIYLALNTLYPAKQFENIATRSEIRHIELVQDLVEWYDLNITNIPDYTISYSQEELTAIPAGIYAIDEIQNLYDALYTKGKSSQQAAFEVGCMVEVTDVNDLDVDIALAGSNAALVDTFNILRNGSYNHYWAFDKGLQNLGINDGCCSLGTDYCHPEYPQSSKGRR